MGPPRPILYSFRRCPYAMRARLALAAAGKNVSLREVILRDKPAEMLVASPKGTVPVLVLADGEVIEESLQIMRWAFAETMPDVDFALIERNDGEFKASLDRYKYPERHPDLPQSDYREQGCEFLAELESRLSLPPALSGNDFGFLDWAIAPFVRQFAAVDREWFEASPFPKVREWQRTFVDSALFELTMRKVPQWKSGDAGVDFPASSNA